MAVGSSTLADQGGSIGLQDDLCPDSRQSAQEVQRIASNIRSGRERTSRAILHKVQIGDKQELNVDFEQFRTSWLESVEAGQPSTRELGRRFALKLVTQWADASENASDIVMCDGSGDGGIDIALLDTGPDSSNDAPEESGHSWYLVQSKYGSAFAGVGTLLIEGQKVIETLDGKRSKLSSLAEGTLERLTNFRNGAGRPLTESFLSLRLRGHSTKPSKEL